MLRTANVVLESITKDLDGINAPQPSVVKSGQGSPSIDKVLESSMNDIEK